MFDMDLAQTMQHEYQNSFEGTSHYQEGLSCYITSNGGPSQHQKGPPGNMHQADNNLKAPNPAT